MYVVAWAFASAGAARSASQRPCQSATWNFQGGWFMGQASTSPLVDSPRVREAYILILVTRGRAASSAAWKACIPALSRTRTRRVFRVALRQEIWYVKGGYTLWCRGIVVRHVHFMIESVINYGLASAKRLLRAFSVSAYPIEFLVRNLSRYLIFMIFIYMINPYLLPGRIVDSLR